MTNLRKSKFVPLARHALDLKSIRRTQQAVNALLNNRMIVGNGSVGKIHNSDSNTVYELPLQESNDMIFPFKLYQIKNVSATPIQISDFSSLGLNINNFTFQIRSGLVSGRSYINAPGAGNDSTLFLPTNPYAGNFEIFLYATCTDSPPDNNGNVPEDFFYQPSANKGTCIVLDSTQPTLIFGIPKNSPLGSAIVFNEQIALNPAPDMGVGDPIDSFWNAAFWLELVDDPLNGFYVNLMGCMYSNAQDSTIGRTSSPFPFGPNIVPIGVVEISRTSGSTGLATVVQNIVTDNQVNRFPPTLGNQRGSWVELFAALPAGITKLWFYPGDIVVDDSAAIVWNGFNIFGVFQFIGAIPAFSVVANTPQNNLGSWKQIGMIND